MRRITTAIGITVLAGAAFAQQDPQYTQYMFDRLSVNPGFAGVGGNICATALLRQQWSGFDGAPKTGLVNVHAPISKINSGVGMSVYFDKLGQENSTIARLHYAYHFKPGGGSNTLSIGVYGGLTSRSLGNQWVAVDPVTLDDAIPDNGTSAAGFDLGAGIYYQTPKLWAGFSSTQLPQTELKEVSIQNRRHYYLQAGYEWQMKNPKLAVLPSTLLKSDGTSTQFDLTAMVMYDKMVWLGVSYRTEDAIAPIIGYQHQFPKGNSMLRIGYSYDVTTSELRNYSSGSHEVMLNYCFKIVKPKVIEIYGHPRFL